MEDKKLLDDIVSMLDNFMTDGGGHMNIDVNTLQEEMTEKSVQQLGCTDCSSNNKACQVPTLHEGLDDNATE